MQNRVVVALRLLCVPWCAWAVCVGSGCDADKDPHAPDGARAERDAAPAVDAAEPVAASKPALCDRTERDDAVRDLFCSVPAAQIESLLDLQHALHLVIDAQQDQPASYGKVVMLAHSTALSGDLVSELNPRAIIVNEGVLLAFNRGIQQVEIAIADRVISPLRLNFYLLRFDQACNADAIGCKPYDLFTPRIESDWLHVTADDDEDLKNTPSDCRQCHQRGREKPMLLMRELEGPWTHFFGPDMDDNNALPEPSGSALLRDYLRAKGDESYANLPQQTLSRTVGLTLEGLVSGAQPLIFDGSAIMNERWPWRDGAFPPVPVRSATWEAGWTAFKRGERLPLPYFTPRVTDPDKQAQLTAAYQRYREGTLGQSDFPDFADIFPDDPQTRAEIGLRTEPEAAPVQLLIQACGSCHNDVLDQSISRANFNIALGRMSRDELDVAIARIELPRNAVGAMPPPGRREVAAESLPALIEYLRITERSDEEDAQLEHAAQLGMAVPVPQRTSANLN